MYELLPRRLLAAIALTTVVALGGCATMLGAVSDEDGYQTPETDRTMGRAIDDEVIENVALVNIRKASEGLADSHIRVTSFNGIVLLTGQVRAQPLKRQAEEVTMQLRNVRRVYNELEVAGPTSLLARSGDAWVNNKVKARLIANESAPGRDIRVVTENGVVYLMGLIRRNDADAAAEIARNTGGVVKVVRMFEYVD
ncbi:MAG: BON domain-containing protein [Pseudomonadota bacterium]|nr:BON domain-containing protein [Pseudomonadota bacterium]